MRQDQHKRLAGAVTAQAWRRWLARAACLVVLAGAWPFAPPPADAQPRLPNEYQIKAAFIYNFAQFIEWPAGAFASPDAPFIIGILGNDPFGQTFEQTVGDKTVGDRPIRILRFGAGQSPGPCHLLYVSASERARLTDIRQKLKVGVLTVGDMDGFAARGGMIGLVVEENKIRFEINIESAERAQLKISSRLLQLARSVQRGAVTQ